MIFFYKVVEEEKIVFNHMTQSERENYFSYKYKNDNLEKLSLKMYHQLRLLKRPTPFL